MLFRSAMIENAASGLVRLLKKSIGALSPKQISDSLARLDIKINLMEISLPQPTAICDPIPAEKGPTADNVLHRGSSQELQIEMADVTLKALFAEVRQFTLGLGDDVAEKTMKSYVGYKRKMNFLCCQVQAKSHRILAWLALNPDTIKATHGFIRDVRKVGHHGTGDAEVVIADLDDLEKVKPLIVQSYREGR